MPRLVSPFCLAMLLLSAAGLGACAAAPAPDAASERSGGLSVAGINDDILKAQALRKKGDYDGAIKILGQLVLVSPDNVRVIGEYGKVLVLEGRAREAVEFLDRAVVLDSSDWSLQSALGVACDEAGDYAKAKIAYEAALRLKPDEAIVLNNYALSRLMAGDPTVAQTLIRKAVALSSDAKIARNLAMIDSFAASHPPAAAAREAPAAPEAEPKPAPKARTLPAKSSKAAGHKKTKTAAVRRHRRHSVSLASD
jgi:Flp pilus assembly protein TadD